MEHLPRPDRAPGPRDAAAPGPGRGRGRSDPAAQPGAVRLRDRRHRTLPGAERALLLQAGRRWSRRTSPRRPAGSWTSSAPPPSTEDAPGAPRRDWRTGPPRPTLPHMPKPWAPLFEIPWVYRAWQAPFRERKLAPIRRHNDLTSVRRVLDVGCGPGTNAPHFRGMDYLGLDINPAYVERARTRYGMRFEVADVTRHEVRGEPFDFILVNSLFHHIDDEGCDRILGHLATLLTDDGRIHVLDLVLPPDASPARLLARMDRGDHPRPLGSVGGAPGAALRGRSLRALRPRAWRAWRSGRWSTSAAGRAACAEPGAGVSDPRVSVAVPLFNEEESFAELHRRVGAVLDALPGGPHEIVLVDDGSTDRHARAHGGGRGVRPARRRGVAVPQLRPPARAVRRPRPLLGRRGRPPGRRPPGPTGGDPPLPRRAPGGLRRRLRQARASQGAALAPLLLLGVLPAAGVDGPPRAPPRRRGLLAPVPPRGGRRSAAPRSATAT